MRRVIQISSTPAEGSPGNEHNRLFALCDDGSLWAGVERDSGWQWLPIDNVPQGEVGGYSSVGLQPPSWLS